MKIIDVKQTGNAIRPDEYPPEQLPEIAMIGRSNVGKSTLLNFLLQRNKLVKTSGTPGRTRRIHFFEVNMELTLVDLPGYGYTKAPRHVSERWREAIDQYFATRKTLRGVFHLVDIRHVPTEMDRRVSKWLRDTNLLAGTIAVKSDKIPRSKHDRHLKIIRDTLGLTREDVLLMSSALKKTGRESIWREISARVTQGCQLQKPVIQDSGLSAPDR